MGQSVLRNTHQEAVVKVWGTDTDSETIDISTLLATNQVLDGSTQTVNLIGATWTGHYNTVITLTRNSVPVITMPSTGSSNVDFGGQQLPPDTTENTSDLVVSFVGGQGEVWLKLRKTGGYKTTIEYATYGSYDDPSVAGS